MYISRLRLRNFRNFQKAEFRFSEGVNTLIGENGSGKTNAFQAIRLLLDDSLPRGAIRLRESDFNRSLDSWKGAWIIISLDFDDLDASEGCQVIRHGVGHMDGRNSGTYTLIFRPNKVIRKTLFELSTSGDADVEIQRTLDDLTVEHYESLITGRATADFLDDEVYEKLVGDFDKLTFPDPQDDASLIGDRMLQPLHCEVSCTCAANAWIKPFYAHYTFEVDFLMARNEDEVVATLGTIYKQPAASPTDCQSRPVPLEPRLETREHLHPWTILVAPYKTGASASTFTARG